jgi:hypothetical protein
MAVNDIVMGAAGASGPATYIEDVFSTWLYTGNGSTQTITNGIDLSGKGGMTWIKSRSAATNNFLFDTTRGVLNEINSNTTEAQASLAASLTAFNATGFSLGAAAGINVNAATYASWTFREQPKFFDIVTYTGNGTNNRIISHNLGSTPAFIIVKVTNSSDDWYVYHKDLGLNAFLSLNSTSQVETRTGAWNNISDTGFGVGTTQWSKNSNGSNYVAYLFAHDAGGFGTNGTDNVISCGSYTGNGSTTGPTVTLGYEPQWILIKRAETSTSGSGNWNLIDNMRGMPVGSNDSILNPNLSDAESNNKYASPNSTGFLITSTNLEVNSNGIKYIYIAIRRPMKTPTTGTSVFSPQTYTSTDVEPRTITTGFVTDTALYKPRTSNGGMDYKWRMSDRLRGVGIVGTNSGSELSTNDTNSENYTNSVTASNSSFQSLALMNGVTIGYLLNRTDDGGNVDYVGYNFKRAAGFFDVVCYTGTGVARTINHNLTVAPEMMIVKGRSNISSWNVYVSPLTANYKMEMETTVVAYTSAIWNNTTPTPSVFSLDNSAQVNGSSRTYIAYLFASIANVSKVGSYTGNGSSQTINCSFTTGARFVMIKRTDSTGDWYVWDTARGIVAGNDPHLSLNTTAAEVTTDDSIDAASSGFIVNQLAATNINVNAATYIFLAIA